MVCVFLYSLLRKTYISLKEASQCSEFSQAFVQRLFTENKPDNFSYVHDLLLIMTQ
jgi:hypothetical protein